MVVPPFFSRIEQGTSHCLLVRLWAGGPSAILTHEPMVDCWHGYVRGIHRSWENTRIRKVVWDEGLFSFNPCQVVSVCRFLELGTDQIFEFPSMPHLHQESSKDSPKDGSPNCLPLDKLKRYVSNGPRNTETGSSRLFPVRRPKKGYSLSNNHGKGGGVPQKASSSKALLSGS